MAFIGNTPTTQAFTPAVDVFSGNGSTTAFTLSRPVASVAQVQAFIENVPQSPVDAFTVSGNTIAFTSAPPSGSSNIYVRYTSPITQVIAPSDGSVGTSKLVDAAVTSAKMAAGAAVSNIGAGGITSNELATAVKPLGVGQTWQDVSASRALGTTYTNSTGRPIMVAGSTYGASSQTQIQVDGAPLGTTSSSGLNGFICAVVPSGSTYKILVASGSATLGAWTELR